jgi:hypothetical protein
MRTSPKSSRTTTGKPWGAATISAVSNVRSSGLAYTAATSTEAKH